MKSSRASLFCRLFFAHALLLCSQNVILAQTATTWVGGNGFWPDASKWTAGVPNSASADVYIDNQPGTASVVTLSSPGPNNPADFTMGRLRIDAGDRLDTGSTFGQFLVSNSAFSGAGELLINGTFAMPLGGRSLTGNPITINGTGALVLGGPGQRTNVQADLTNNATVEGTSLFGAANSSRYHTFNNGTINANVPGMHMDFHNVGNVNTGLLKASNGGQLLLGQGSWDNTQGDVEADGANSFVAFYRGGLFEGGTLTAKNGGYMQVGGSFNGSNGGHTFKNVTLNGPMNLVDTMLITGTLTNNGTIAIPDGARLHNFSGAALTIAGTGEIVLNGTNDGAPELIDQGDSSVPSVPWTFDGVKVRGRGNVGYINSNGAIDNVLITNKGTFQADVDGQTLLIDVAGFNNQNGGLLRATGSGNNPLGGVLRLAINGALKNTGGTIEALNGGCVEAAFARIEGGVVRNVGGKIPLSGMTLVNPTSEASVADGSASPDAIDPNGMILEGELTLGLAGANQGATFVGEIKNSGALRIAASGGNTSWARLGESAKPYLNLTGGGQIILGTFADGTAGNDEARLFENLDGGAPGRTLRNVDNTIHGFGWLGGDPTYGYNLTLDNSATIAADVSARTLRVGFNGGTNTGFIRSANGGTLNLRTTGLTNAGGVLEALNTSPFNFTGPATITGGTLRNVGAAANATNFDLGNATVVNPTALQGPFIVENGKNFGVAGVIPNQGSIRVLSAGNATAIMLGLGGMPDVSFVGGGEIVLGDTGSNYGGTLAGIYETGNNTTLTLENQKLSGFGDIGLLNVRQLDVNNKTSVEANQNARELRFYPRTLTNTPPTASQVMMQARDGGHLYLAPNQLNNQNAAIAAKRSAIGTSAVKFGITTVSGGAVSSEAADATNPSAGRIEIHHNLTANGGAVFTNAGTMNIAEYGGTEFNGIANGGASIISSGTINKLGGTDYTVNTPLNDTGAIHVQSGILRWFAGGMVSGANLSAATGTHLTFQNAPFTFSGINTFTGAGNHWFANIAVTLADAATTLNVPGNFNLGSVGTTTVTGPGKFSVTGGLTIHNGPSIFSGVQLFTASGVPTILNSGSSLQFQNAANWENSGSVSMSGFNASVTGAADTRFTNTGLVQYHAGGNESNIGVIDIPSENSGRFEAAHGRLFFTKPAKWTAGKASVSGTAELIVQNTPMTLSGTANASTGAGFLQLTGTSSLLFDPGAQLAADRIQFNDATGTTGAGELKVSAAANFFPPSFQTSVIDGTKIRLLAGSTNRLENSAATLRLTNGAVLQNAGTLNIHRRVAVELNSGAVLENAGTLTTTSPGAGPSFFGGDGTGLFRTLAGSTTRFFYSGDPNEHHVSVPFDLAGQFYADPGAYTVFNRGGLLNETAKIWPNGPGATITFTGTAPVQSRGRAVEFSGVGSVNFVNTTLEFLPSTLSTTGNGQLDETSINAGARVAFLGAPNSPNRNTVKSSQALLDLGRQGTLNTTGFIFASGDVDVDNAILQTSGTADNTVWNATGRKLTLRNNAKFINGGKFVIQSKVGSGVTGDPGITTDSSATLFHNTSTGRLVHDSNTTTDLNIDFQNDGFLEFRAGQFNFLKKFSGRGGIATSNGAKISLSLVGVPESQHPQKLEMLGAGSAISLNLAAGQTFGGSIFSDAGQLVAAGGLNMVASGGLNMVAAGGGNLVAAGGMNMVAAGGGNITASGVASLINANELVGLDGGSLVGLDGGTLIARLSALISNGGSASLSGAQTKMDVGASFNVNNASALIRNGAQLSTGGQILSQNGSTVIARDGAGVIARDGAGVIARDGAGVIARDGASIKAPAGQILSQNGGQAVAEGVGAKIEGQKMIGLDGGTLIGNDGSTMVAAGSLNRPTGSAGPVANAPGDAGTIVVASGSTIAGNGTFVGAGYVQASSFLRPGKPAATGGNDLGAMTWTGSLQVDAGGTLLVEVGGTAAGTQHDRVNVSGAFTMNGSLAVRFLNGFGGAVQAAQTFDVVKAAGGITTNLAGSRVSVFGSTGSFLIQLVDNGTTLRLTDFQSAPVTFNNWASAFGLTGPAAAMSADPNKNGLANLLEYALGLDPTQVGGSFGTTLGTVLDNGVEYLSLSYTKPTGSEARTDIIYAPERATSLMPNAWSTAGIVPVGTVPGPGSLETVTVRSASPLSSTAKEFLRLSVSTNP